MSARVFTIPAGAPFLSVLAEALLSGRFGPLPGDDPLALADVTVLLPTRRSVRAFREVMTGKLGGEAAILPRIRPIGDVDEEDHLLSPAVESGAERLMLPPAISAMSRRLALTRLTLAWGQAVRREILGLKPDDPLLVPASAADATRLAADLATLIDDMQIAGVPWERLAKLAPEGYARYFQITLDFLKIASEAWPRHLAEHGLADPEQRRGQLIRAEAERLAAGGARGPVIAAGSTGSIPSTAILLRAIAGMPNGAVVLPGLDQDLDEAAWQAIGAEDDWQTAVPGHPQFGMKQLIGRLGIARADVVSLGAVPPATAARSRLVSEGLRPAATTDTWASFSATAAPADVERALAGVDLIEARNEQQEAVAIAIAMREALEDGLGRIALVTPERALARRVAAELGRWHIAVDDSAGAPLDRLPAGIFARLLIEAATGNGDPVALLSLLKHPLAAFGMTHGSCRAAARALEIALFRGRRVVGGVTQLGPALAAAGTEAEAEGAERAHIPFARRRLFGEDWDRAARLAAALADTLGPVEEALSARTIGADEAARLLLDALHGAATDDTRTADALWESPDGAALRELLEGLVTGGGGLRFGAGEAAAFLGALMADVAVNRPAGADPRIHIWGTLEARLQSADLLILGGLDEAVWPADTRTDPWLSRAMRAEIGLPPPERRIGLAAHDFAEAFAAPRVIVTRAAKRGGKPLVASRWLQRLKALAGEAAIKAMSERGRRFLDLAADLDSADHARPVKAPQPKPAVEHRPRRLSVTEIETLIRDPYAIYARRVLGLEPLEPPGRPPDYALRGSLMHQAIGDFTRDWTGPYDAAAEARLLDIGRAVLAEIADFPDIHAVWWLRFQAIAKWLIGWERRRAADIAARHAEISGAFELPAPGGPFRLTGRADRIDLRHDGRVEIYDYKTGTPPRAKQILTGESPQLGLEAAMVRGGGFGPPFAGHPIAELAWIGLSRVERGRPETSAVGESITADQLAEEASGLFARLIADYDQPDRPYVSWARPMFETRYESPYDHLARVREWGLVESEEDLLDMGGFRP